MKRTISILLIVLILFFSLGTTIDATEYNIDADIRTKSFSNKK